MTQIIDREQDIVFTNYTDEDFECKWNKKIWRFKANTSFYLPFWLAEHCARHLVQRELNKMATKEIAHIRSIDPRIDSREVDRREQAILTNARLRQELMDKCVQVTEPEALGVATPRMVPREQIKLKADERREAYIEQGKVAPSDVPARQRSAGAGQPSAESSFEGAASPA